MAYTPRIINPPVGVRRDPQGIKMKVDNTVKLTVTSLEIAVLCHGLILLTKNKEATPEAVKIGHELYSQLLKA